MELTAEEQIKGTFANHTTANQSEDIDTSFLKAHKGDFNSSSISPLRSFPDEDIRRNKLKLEGAKNLQFPLDLSAHAMVFHFKVSSMRKNNTKNRPVRTYTSVSLPVPANLLDSTDVQYNEMDLGTLGGALSDTQSLGQLKAGAIGAVVEAFDAGSYMATGDFQSMKNNAGIATIALTNMMRKYSPGAQVGLARFFGNVPNPHLTALFKGVGLKNHSFSWRLSPANIKESVELQRIIQLFKRGMLPKRENQNLTLEFPDEVDIYIRGHQKNFHMYEFKTAVIKNVTVNFAPDNIPSFYAGTGAPTHVDFKVDFLETTIHTRNDYPDEAILPVGEAGEVGPSISTAKNPGGLGTFGGGGNHDVGKGGYSTKQRHQGVVRSSTEAGGGFGHKPPGAGPQGAVPGIVQGRRSLSTQQGGAFGHKPGGAGAANNPFIGRNPNL